MITKIYGSGDDNVEIEGEFSGEYGCFGTDDEEHGVLVICSDGTLLEVKYGKAGMGIWGITLINQGSLFDHIQTCMDEDADPYSDIAFFKDGLKWAYASRDWEKVN